jgi:hypothetical protein
MSPRLLYVLSALRAHRALQRDRDRFDGRRAATRMFIGVPLDAPHRRVTLALHRLRDHGARDGRVRIADLRARAGRG